MNMTNINLPQCGLPTSRLVFHLVFILDNDISLTFPYDIMIVAYLYS